MEMNELSRGQAAQREERISLREIELIKYRDNRTALVIKLVTGEQIEGSIRWYDDRAIRFVRDDRSELTVHLHAISYYHTRS